MNILLTYRDDRINNSDIVRITGRRFDHIVKVIKPEVGDKLRCGELGGQLGIGKITKISSEYLELRTTLTEDPPQKNKIKLVLALPRPKYLRRIIQSVTSLGVEEIFLINSERVEKSYWDSLVLAEDMLKEQLILGLEQSGDTILPKISLKRFFKPFIEDELELLSRQTLKVLAHPGSEMPCPSGCEGKVTLAMGPEGGFIPYEVESFIGAGFETVNLGDRILKTETAVPAFIYKIMPGQRL